MIIGNPITLGGGGGAKGQPLSNLTEGSLVSVLEDGKLTPFYVAKHDYESDLNGEGRTLLVRKNVHSSRAWNSSNINSYANSTIDTWLNGDYKNLLSSTVKANMGLTNINYTVGNGDSTVKSLSRAVFLLSISELNLAVSWSSTEGTLLPIASTLRVAYTDSNTVISHWTRSIYLGASYTKYACYATATGSVDAAECNSSNYYARPCFTLPATMTLTLEPYADGSWGLADEDILFDTETASTTAKAGVTYTNGIADLDADTLHTIAAAISANPKIDKYMGTIYYDKGDVHRKISTGDTQNIDVGGTSYAVNIIGFNHDELAAATAGTSYGAPTATGKAGITFQMVDCLATTYAMNNSATNSGGWYSSVMRGTHMVNFRTSISERLRNAIKPVYKYTSIGNKSTSVGAATDNLFLLSEIEVLNTTTRSVAGEGSQYAYYKAGNSKIKKRSGSASNWWLRSPHGNNTNGFCCVMNTGTGSGLTATDSSGVAFAYCI